MDEFIRSKLHEALDVEQPDPRLRARVMSSLPVDERSGGGFSRPTLEWAGGIIAGLLALTMIASLLYIRGGLFPSSQTSPHEKWRADSGMVSRTTGWVFLPASANLIRTSDGGLRWVDVKPKAYVVSSEPAGQFFLDANHAWVTETVADNPAAAPSGKTITVAASLFVLSTADGGRHWQRGAPVSALGMDREPGAVSLHFIDFTRGWMLIDLCCGPESYQLYATTNGGLQWELRASIPEQCLGTPHPFRVFTFSSLTTGWLTTPCASDPLLVTHDGGRTWQSQALPIVGTPNLTTVPGGAQVAHPPVFIDHVHGIFLMNGTAGRQLLLTSDGGTSWTIRALPGGVETSLDFVEIDRGWVVTAPQAGDLRLTLYWTDDGALTWTRIQTDLELTSQAGSLDSIYFVDHMNGFATRASALANPELWKTNDGGHTWTLVGPIRLSL
jgi:photosystem II stability/assembly factor-like uncharacterized protein